METICKSYAHLNPHVSGYIEHTTNHSGPTAYTPMDLAKVYNFPPGLNGAGQKVAFIELGGGFRQTDLNNYFTRYGVGHTPPTVQFVSVSGAANHPTNVNSPDIEVMLDLITAIGVAPGITPYVYMAPNTDSGFVAAINAAVNNRVNIISISWGAPENEWSGTAINNMNAAFQAAINAGISVFVAAGDSGSGDGESGNHVDFPGSSPYVTCCGGTNIQSSSNVWTSETVWHDSYGSTGGGFSASFNTPSWQTIANTGNNKRGVPDVAAVADPATGIIVPVDGGLYVVGGTSGAAPFWAGLTAVLNQGLRRNLGFLNSIIYPIAMHYSGPNSNNPFHDVTSGSNGAFSAKLHWDACTGLGTPNANILFNALK